MDTEITYRSSFLDWKKDSLYDKLLFEFKLQEYLILEKWEGSLMMGKKWSLADFCIIFA